MPVGDAECVLETPGTVIDFVVDNTEPPDGMTDDEYRDTSPGVVGEIMARTLGVTRYSENSRFSRIFTSDDRAPHSSRRRRRVLRRRRADGRPRGRREGAPADRRRNAREPRRRVFRVLRGAKFGVRSAMPISRALRLCPAGDVRSRSTPRLRREESRDPRRARASMPLSFEGASIDEWYMDLGGTEGSTRRAARRDGQAHPRAVEAETTLSVRSAAVPRSSSPSSRSSAPNRSREPTRLACTSLPPARRADFSRRSTSPNSAHRSALSGTSRKPGMRTVPDVLQYDMPTLTQWLGAREAEWLFDRVRGVDHSEVEAHGDAKSISRDETFAADIDTDDELARELLALVTRAAADLRGDGLTARTVTVRIRDHDFKTRQASRTLDAAVISDRVILEVAHLLLAKLRKARRVAGAIDRRALSSLAADATADQLTLFERRDDATCRNRSRPAARPNRRSGEGSIRRQGHFAGSAGRLINSCWLPAVGPWRDG